MAYTIEKEWVTEAGLKAYVLFINESHNCGYVESPKEFEGDDYTEHYDIYVHGDLTFAGEHRDIDIKWLFGFDAAHLGDKTAHGDYPGDTFRDVNYMAKECESLATQLKEKVS